MRLVSTASLVRRLSSVVAVLAMASVAWAGDATNDEQAIRALEAQWVKAVAAKDTEWIANLYAPDGRLMPPNSPASQGREAIRAAWSGMMATPGFVLTFAPTEIHVAKGGDVAYDIGTSEGANNDQGKYVVVWKKLDGEWKVAADIFNSDGPGK